MRKIIFYFATCIATTLLVSFVNPPADPGVIGKWKDLKHTGDGMTFDKDGYLIMISEGVSHGGKNFIEKGDTGSLTYEVNPKTNPKSLDITVTMFRTKEQRTMKCIYEFISPTKMRVRMNTGEDNTRPAKFGASEDEDTMIIEKTN